MTSQECKCYTYPTKCIPERKRKHISRNASYITLFKTPSDQEMISKLGQRIFTVHNRTCMDIYRTETDRPHGYLLIVLKQATNQITHKVVASVFGPGECVRYAIDTVVPETLHSRETQQPEQLQIEDDKQLQRHAIIAEPMISENIVQQSRPNGVNKVERMYLRNSSSAIKIM